MTVNELRILVENLDEYINVPGGIDRLKKMVLHLAVSGKLVPQDQTEGTGKELYQQIQTERIEILKKGKVKIQKPQTLVSDDEITYDIPISWEWSRLGSISHLITDGTHHTPKYQSSGVPFLSIKDISAGSLDFSNCKFISVDEHRSINERCNPEYGDILFCRIGTLGRPIVVNTDKPFSIFVSLGLIKFPQSLVASEYLRIYLQAPETYRQYSRIMAGGSHTNKLNLVSMRSLTVALPPVAEQKRIVAKVGSIFALIDQLSTAHRAEQVERTKLVASTLAQLASGDVGATDSLSLRNVSEIIRTKADAKILRQTILHLAISGQHVPQDASEGTGEALYQQIKSVYSAKKVLLEISEDDKPFNIPDNWRWVRLPEIYRSQSPVTKLKTTDYLKSGKYPIVDQGQRYIAGYTNDGEPNRVSVPVTIFGDHTREIKLIDFDFVVGADGVKILEPILVDSQFFYTLIDVFRPQSRGYGRHFKMLNDKIVPFPPLAEQKRIVTKTTHLLDLVAELERYLEK